MKFRRIGFGFALLVAVVIVGIWWFSPTEVLKRRVADLLDAAEVSELSTDLARQTKGQKIAEYFAEQVKIEPPEEMDGSVRDRINRDQLSRDRLITLYTMAARGSKEISFTDVEVHDVQHDNDRAQVRFQVDCVVDLGTQRPVDGLLDVVSLWVKRNDDWQLVELSWTELGR